jgi:hypothetical protein
MIMPRRRSRARSQGYLLMDALAGLLLLLALTTLLATAVNLRQRNARHLAEQRKALLAAQEVLVNARTTGQPTCTDTFAQVSIARTGQQVGELEWVEVSVEREGRHASLVGLAPAGGSP